MRMACDDEVTVVVDDELTLTTSRDNAHIAVNITIEDGLLPDQIAERVAEQLFKAAYLLRDRAKQQRRLRTQHH